MQLAWQRGNETDEALRTDESLDYTPSGVYPIGRADRSSLKTDLDPLIVVHELEAAEAAEIALLELHVSEDEWNDDEPTHSFRRQVDDTPEIEVVQTFELLPPVTLDAKLPIVGDDWFDDEETARFERGVPVLLPQAFEHGELQEAADLAEEFNLAATGEFVVQRFSSPWADSAIAALLPGGPPVRTRRSWLLIAAATIAAEAALLGLLALVLG